MFLCLEAGDWRFSLLNVQIMTQMWPYIGEYVEGVLRTTVQPTVQGSLPSKFQNFSFETIDLGDTVCVLRFMP